jgi:uncharacterized protein YoaH (UPF0181 family)
MDKLKQNAVNEAVEKARTSLSSGGLVTSTDEAIAWMADEIKRLKEQSEKGVIRFALGTAYEISTMQIDQSYAGSLLSDAGISSSDKLCAEVIEENESFSNVMNQFGL